MRVAKKKRHRKIVNFYSACYGFRAPFRVLCDGTFVHHLISNGLVPADKALQNSLSDPVKLFTTRCTISELKRLGDSYSEDLKAAKSLLFARCDHDGRKSAEACISEIIGKTNPMHFFVATQDADLREKLQEIPGVPIIFGLRNALILQQPSASQRQFVKSSEEARAHMTGKEFNLLSKRVKNKVTQESNSSLDEDEDIDDQTSEIQDMQKVHIARKVIGVKDTVQFKRKKAKGPNPLSCKKKKNRENSNSASEKMNDDENTARSREKKRKRSRKGKKSDEVEGS